MLLVKPSVEVLHVTDKPLHLIETAGRTCYKSQKKDITITSAGNFTQKILELGHESVIEHATATVRIVTSRDVTHQLVRHRLISPSQESQRYCDYSGDVRFVVPLWLQPDDPDEIITQYEAGVLPDICDLWVRSRLQDEKEYRAYRKAGRSPGQARNCLPNCAATKIVVTANFREWRHVFALRTDGHADAEMRRVMIPLLAELQDRVPVVFDDVNVAENQEGKQ